MLTSLCFARIVRSTCYRAICGQTDLFDEGLGKFSHPTRKSTYPQYPVKLKSLSATRSKKTLRIAS